MKANVQSANIRISFVILLIASLFLMVGCNKDTVEPDLDVPTLSADADAAESLASTVGEDNGGLTDQAGDLMSLATNDGFNQLGKTDDSESITREYDEDAGLWTVTLSRERGNPDDGRYALVERIYTVQFLNEDGQPQQFWNTDGDTARTIKFDIVEGVGRHITRRLSQQLTGLSGSFIATNTHTDLVTINGNYFRSAVDTVTTQNAVRTLDHSIDLTVTDLVGPRGSRRDLSQKISGTISGTYAAFATFTSGNGGYREREINRTFTINIGNGEAQIQVGGENYRSDIQSGELSD